MFIVMCQIDFRDEHTKQEARINTPCMCLVPLFSSAQCHIHLRSVFQTRYLILLRASPSGSPFHSYCFKFLLFFFPSLFKNSVLLQGVSQKLKSSFQAPSFRQDEYQLARWISVGQSVERKGFWQDFWRPRSSSCLSFLQFSHNWLSRTAAIKTPYQMQTEESQSFMIHQ